MPYPTLPITPPLYVRICILGLLSWNVVPTHAQTLQVYTTAGMEMETPHGSLHWTIGEPLIRKLDTLGRQFTQGFQQSTFLTANKQDSPTTPTPRLLGDKINYYPNPVYRRLTIEDPYRRIQKIMLHKSTGILIARYIRENSEKFFLIDMANLPDGVYLFRLLDEDDRSFKRFRIVKQQ